MERNPTAAMGVGIAYLEAGMYLRASAFLQRGIGRLPAIFPDKQVSRLLAVWDSRGL